MKHIKLFEQFMNEAASTKRIVLSYPEIRQMLSIVSGLTAKGKQTANGKYLYTFQNILSDAADKAEKAGKARVTFHPGLQGAALDVIDWAESNNKIAGYNVTADDLRKKFDASVERTGIK